MLVSKKNEEKHAPQVVTPGNLTCIYELINPNPNIVLHQIGVLH